METKWARPCSVSVRKTQPSVFSLTKKANEILISGMGELHLEVYIERIRREYGVEIEVGAPKVSYRESPTKEISYDYKHKKQSWWFRSVRSYQGQAFTDRIRQRRQFRVPREYRRRPDSKAVHSRR